MNLNEQAFLSPMQFDIECNAEIYKIDHHVSLAFTCSIYAANEETASFIEFTNDYNKNYITLFRNGLVY